MGYIFIATALAATVFLPQAAAENPQRAGEKCAAWKTVNLVWKLFQLDRHNPAFMSVTQGTCAVVVSAAVYTWCI